MNYKAFILLPLIASLAACGGNDSTATRANTGTVSLVVTDNLTLAYSEVWVNIRSIAAIDANGQSVILYEDLTGQTHNLSQLVNVGSLVDTQSVAPGTYTSFKVTLANAITLVDQVGMVTNATFDQSSHATYTIRVPGGLTVDANQNVTLALDFNLERFTYNAITNRVTPDIVQKDHRKLHQIMAKTKGQIDTVVSPTQFILTPASGGAKITVNLHSSATVINHRTGVATTDTSGLESGMLVKVTGSYDVATLTITAAAVVIKESSAAVRDEIEGKVIFFDGATLTVDVEEGSFTPDSNTMNIINFETAKFSRGTLSMLSVGQQVEIKGVVVDGYFSAAIIEIEGARRSTGHHSEHANSYAELKGQISAVNGSDLTITVSKSEHVNGVSNGSSVIINTSNSLIRKGDDSCLVVGAKIEVKGAMNDSVAMDASLIKIKTGCAGDDDRESSDDD